MIVPLTAGPLISHADAQLPQLRLRDGRLVEVALFARDFEHGEQGEVIEELDTAAAARENTSANKQLRLF